jgi:diaminohydroxyphosphoribosylaminopyrimidine deaminase / 5-amino-6-(5-phosphoribosylamino)uracil reductase
MSLAFKLANLHNGITFNNPSVGALILYKNKIISYGITGIGGSPHAEYDALKKIKSKKNKYSLYSTLEPCHHEGKNPSCSDFIKKKNITRVLYSDKDCNIKVSGKGLRYLSNNKIKINNIKNNFANNFYKEHNDFSENYYPKVFAKIATTKNYYSFIKGRKKITNVYLNKYTHLLRSQINAILVGVLTVNIDNPILNCRIEGFDNLSPARFIIDPRLNINTNSTIVKTSKHIPTYIFYSFENNYKIKFLSKKNVKLIYIPNNNKFLMDPKEILYSIGLLGYKNVLIEGGLKTIELFLKDKLIDRFYFFKNNDLIDKNASHSFYKVHSYLKNNFKRNKVLEQVYIADNSIEVYQR